MIIRTAVPSTTSATFVTYFLAYVALDGTPALLVAKSSQQAASPLIGRYIAY